MRDDLASGRLVAISVIGVDDPPADTPCGRSTDPPAGPARDLVHRVVVAGA